MEDTVLRVKGSSSATALGSAIAHGVYNGKKIVLRAIGAAANNQAVKAVAIAGGLVAPRGYILSMRPGFIDVTMPDGEITGMVFKILVDES
jgi:stage V sporulation protein S